jgi:8-oxo-dGTP diphosphatase
MKRFTIVSAIISRDEEIVLVANAWGNQLQWSLPGGLIEPGEDFVTALRREVQEETNLDVDRPNRLCYVVHSCVTQLQEEAIIFAFDFAKVAGTLAVADDDYVKKVGFFSKQQIPHVINNPANSLPLLDYLNAPSSTGTPVYYFDDADGRMSLRYQISGWDSAPRSL